MTAALTDLLAFLGVGCLVVLGGIGALFTRRVAIRRRGGTFDCSLRLTPAAALAGVPQIAVPPDSRGGAAGPPASPAEQVAGPSVPAGLQRAAMGRQQVTEAGTGTRSIGASGAGPDAGPVERGTRVPFSASGVRAGRGWSYGIAQYENDRIDWYRIFSYAYRPAAVLARRDLEVLSRRDAAAGEEVALFPGWTIVECRFGAGLVELAMAPDALTGFLSWLESAPPGQGVSRVS